MKRSVYPLLTSSFYWAGFGKDTIVPTLDNNEALDNENNIPERYSAN